MADYPSFKSRQKGFQKKETGRVRDNGQTESSDGIRNLPHRGSVESFTRHWGELADAEHAKQRKDLLAEEQGKIEAAKNAFDDKQKKNKIISLFGGEVKEKYVEKRINREKVMRDFHTKLSSGVDKLLGISDINSDEKALLEECKEVLKRAEHDIKQSMHQKDDWETKYFDYNRGSDTRKSAEKEAIDKLLKVHDILKQYTEYKKGDMLYLVKDEDLTSNQSKILEKLNDDEHRNMIIKVYKMFIDFKYKELEKGQSERMILNLWKKDANKVVDALEEWHNDEDAKIQKLNDLNKFNQIFQDVQGKWDTFKIKEKISRDKINQNISRLGGMLNQLVKNVITPATDSENVKNLSKFIYNEYDKNEEKVKIITNPIKLAYDEVKYSIPENVNSLLKEISKYNSIFDEYRDLFDEKYKKPNNSFIDDLNDLKSKLNANHQDINDDNWREKYLCLKGVQENLMDLKGAVEKVQKPDWQFLPLA